MARIGKREDVSPEEGKREYGDVDFADPTNKKYPIDSAEHGLVLLEAELFEPTFNLHLVPEVVETFADAILARALGSDGPPA